MAASTVVRIRLTPRGGRDAVLGWDGEVLRVKVAAPAVQGQANRALLRLLARELRVPLTALTLARGERSRDKTVAVSGLDADGIRGRLGGRP